MDKTTKDKPPTTGQWTEMERSRVQRAFQKAVRSAADFNARLNAEKREERSAYYDLSLDRLLVPRRPIAARAATTSPPHGAYPVQLLPGQYCDSFRALTAAEMKFLPLCTQIYEPTPSMLEKHDDWQYAERKEESGKPPPPS